MKSKEVNQQSNNELKIKLSLVLEKIKSKQHLYSSDNRLHYAVETKDIQTIIAEECAPKKIDPNDLKVNNCEECEHGCFNIVPEIEVLVDGTCRGYHGVSFGPQAAIVCCSKKKIQFDPKLLGQFHCESMVKRSANRE